MNLSATLINATAPVVPMHWQIKAAHLAQKVIDKSGINPPVPEFTEAPLPTADTLDIGDIDLSNPFLWRQGKFDSYAKRLRDQQPVHYKADSPFGPFWSITRYEDIVFVDKHHDLFSAEPIILLGDRPRGLELETFIAMDPPKHDEQRRAVQEVVAPKNLKEMEELIRSRTKDVLDNLPTDQPFNWVERVSIELTARMLATLFDFPYDRRLKLVEWSNLAASAPESTGGVADRDALFPAVAEMA
nr:cytochrome P450 [Actinomycetes bacterium]